MDFGILDNCRGQLKTAADLVNRSLLVVNKTMRLTVLLGGLPVSDSVVAEDCEARVSKAEHER